MYPQQNKIIRYNGIYITHDKKKEKIYFQVSFFVHNIFVNRTISNTTKGARSEREREESLADVAVKKLF